MLNVISTCRDIVCVDINVDKRCIDHSTRLDTIFCNVKNIIQIMKVHIYLDISDSFEDNRDLFLEIDFLLLHQIQITLHLVPIQHRPVPG